MKSSILLLALSVFVFSSCTTAYKTGQTPDDLYYSAAKPQDEQVNSDQKEDDRYRYDDQYYDDRYLRMKVHNRSRWNDLNDWYYYDKYSYSYNYYFGSYNNPFNAWNYYYNPYCCCHSSYGTGIGNIKIPASPPVVRRHFSLGGYTNTGYNNTNNSAGAYKTPVRTGTKPNYNNSNGLNNTLKTIFSNNNSGNGSSRTYTPSSSSSGSGNSGGSSGGGSGKSGGSSGTVTRPVRN